MAFDLFTTSESISKRPLATHNAGGFGNCRLQGPGLIDTRALVTLAVARIQQPFMIAVSHKYLFEEKSVDVEKLESSWGTTGEQLLPNETVFARKRASRPPQVVDSEQQGPRWCLLLNRFRD